MSNLLKLGVHVSGQQYELLKWRTSPEAEIYYTKEENKEFYKALKKGNMEVIDAIRKEKQKRIEKLKSTLLPLIIITMLFICGCSMIPVSTEHTWDVNSLKESERTFRIKEQTIKVDGKWKSIKFDEGWYLVSEDHIKTDNENQDTLIQSLTALKTAKANYQRKQNVMIIVLIISLLVMIGSIAKHIVGRKK